MPQDKGKTYKRGDGQYNPDHEGASPASKKFGPGSGVRDSRGSMVGDEWVSRKEAKLRKKSGGMNQKQRKAYHKRMGEIMKKNPNTAEHRAKLNKETDAKVRKVYMDALKKVAPEVAKEIAITVATGGIAGVAGAVARGGRAAHRAYKATKAAKTAYKVKKAVRGGKNIQKVAKGASKARQKTIEAGKKEVFETGEATGKKAVKGRKASRVERSQGYDERARKADRIYENQPLSKQMKQDMGAGTPKSPSQLKDKDWIPPKAPKGKKIPSGAKERARKALADKRARTDKIRTEAIKGAKQGGAAGLAGGAIGASLRNTKEGKAKRRGKKK